jgi:hypothetical protein
MAAVPVAAATAIDATAATAASAVNIRRLVSFMAILRLRVLDRSKTAPAAKTIALEGFGINTQCTDGRAPLSEAGCVAHRGTVDLVPVMWVPAMRGRTSRQRRLLCRGPIAHSVDVPAAAAPAQNLPTIFVSAD